MLTEAVRRTIDSSDPRADVCLIFTWEVPPPSDLYATAKSRAERREIARGYYGRAKRPLLDRLRRESVEVVNELEGSQNAILAAPAALWKKLADRPDSPLHLPNLEILPNETIAHTL